MDRDQPSSRRAGPAIAALAASLALPLACGRAAPARAPAPAEVSVVTVLPERVVLTTELPGRTCAFRIAEIRPQVNGIIRERAFVEGTDVAAGALLYRIDPAPYEAAYAQAKAALAMAEASLPALRSRVERLKELLAIHAVGEQEADDDAAELLRAEAGVAVSRAAVETARINLEYTPIRSPIPGRIGRSSVTQGALVTAYQPVPLAVVQQLDPIYVDAPQSSADLLRLRRALASGRLTQEGEARRRVSLVLEDGTRYALQGTLEFRDVTVDPTTGSVSVRMVFPNPDHVLLPGMYVRGIVEAGVNERSILVPQQGVTRDAKGDPYAWVVDGEERVERRAVRLDRAIADRWLVAEGLAAGDRVIVEGLQKIRPGDAVRAVPFVSGTR